MSVGKVVSTSHVCGQEEKSNQIKWKEQEVEIDEKVKTEMKMRMN